MTGSARVILITGAGSGLGRHAAHALAQEGATVVLLGRREQKLNRVHDEIVEMGGAPPIVVPFDLADADDDRFERLATTLAHELGRLDGILHSAAQFVKLGPLEQQRLKHWKSAFTTNVFAPFALTRACLPLLKAAPDAPVLFSAEEHGLRPGQYWGGFGLSQASLIHLAQLFAEEYRDHPTLRFNVLIPGPVTSPMRHRTHPGDLPENLPDATQLMPFYLKWLGPTSRGRSGEIVRPQISSRHA
ncbi:MAG: SDR family NAD(P)-dependent oxidoreductase [Betaproteobacteria bacterium]|nr:SDR family NAD(P)-dependent oxidoreductase [Betaproteobacteria bacterium]